MQLSILRYCAYFCAFPKPGPGFLTPYVVVFFFVQWVQLVWEVIVRFVDDHHYLNILFITEYAIHVSMMTV
jgi:hypothetical protein